MSEVKRVKLSSAQRAEMWRRWKAGQSQHEIGRALGRGHGSIHFWLFLTGGLLLRRAGVLVEP